ncbi:MAG: VOC family protein [Acidimicrobiales bacterium]
MPDGARIFHVNVNCSDLARSRRFYVDGCGLAEGVRTTPEQPQSGVAFGLDRAWWDALILVGASGFDGGAIDLLQWLQPEPTGAPSAALHQAGFQSIGLHVPDLGAALSNCVAHGGSALGAPIDDEDRSDGGPTGVALVRDPDGTVVELAGGDAARLAFVSLTTHDLERSLAFYLTLGFRESARVHGADSRVDVVMDAPGGGEVQLRLVGFESPPVAPGIARPANALGIWRTALLLEDLDGAVAELRRSDVELLSDPQSMAMGPGLPELRFVCSRGPDQEVIELIEVPAPA